MGAFWLPDFISRVRGLQRGSRHGSELWTQPKQEFLPDLRFDGDEPPVQIIAAQQTSI